MNIAIIDAPVDKRALLHFLAAPAAFATFFVASLLTARAGIPIGFCLLRRQMAQVTCPKCGTLGDHVCGECGGKLSVQQRVGSAAQVIACCSLH